VHTKKMSSYISLLSLIISTIAISLTTYTVIENRKQKRIDSYVKAQELLMRPDVQDGRTILYEMRSTGTMPVSPEDRAKVFRSLATFNSAANLAYRGAVPLEWLVDFWHDHLMELQPGYDLAVKSRESLRPIPWPDLGRLMDDARNFRCTHCALDHDDTDHQT
jgi:hypothetical protein